MSVHVQNFLLLLNCLTRLGYVTPLSSFCLIKGVFTLSPRVVRASWLLFPFALIPVFSATGHFQMSGSPCFSILIKRGGHFLGSPRPLSLSFLWSGTGSPREASASKLPQETGLAAPNTLGAEGRARCAVLTPRGQAPCVAPRPSTMQMREPQDSAASQAASANLHQPSLSL